MRLSMWGVISTAVISAANVAVGEVSVDPAKVHGEGGVAQPVLVVPVEIRLNARPKEQQLAVLSLEADLAEGNQPGPAGRIGTQFRDLRTGLQVTSTEWGAPRSRVEFRFALPRPMLERLESHRHGGDGRLLLTLSFRAVLAWVRAHNEMGQPLDNGVPFDLRHGMLAEVALFWSPSVGDLSLVVEQSTWVTQVLPTVGHDAIRLVEVQLPTELADERARAAFGRQLRHFDHRGYRESIAASRDLLHAWEKRMGATRGRPVAAVVAEARGWGEEDPRRRFLDQLWTAAKDLANAVLHEANQPAMLDLSESETRTQFLLTSALSEWLTFLAE
jgi:hypothetical protein